MSEMHLLKWELDGRNLIRFARKAGLSLRTLDQGYAVHAVLTSLFGNGDVSRVPKPFAIIHGHLGETEHVSLLAYSQVDSEGLIQQARTHGDQLARELFPSSSLVSRPMFVSSREGQTGASLKLDTGTRLRFSVRVCPTTRREWAPAGEPKKTRERDAFIARISQLAEGQAAPSREVVYREWLTEQFEASGAKVLSANMTFFRLGPTQRRTQGSERSSRFSRRPDVVFEGALEILDAELFRTRGLARGIGRHRAFGFGMVLIRSNDE